MTPRTELGALARRYDLVIVGGGITGAGILREAVRSGARVLLVEAADFASGTSSASSKLVHGGLRYLKNGQWRLTLESVRERQRLLEEAPGLVDPQPFLMPIYADRKPGRWLMQIGLRIYDAMAGVRRSHWMTREALLAAEPCLDERHLLGAMAYEDARTDDARLVLRLIFEAVAEGATALNYVRAELCQTSGRVRGVRLHDEIRGTVREIDAELVINATGAWAGQLPGAPDGAPRLRPLRGSHLVLPLQRLPLRHAVSWLHPQDGRPVFAYPWEGAVVYGTTDLDHREDLAALRITSAELDYLLAGLSRQFPRLRITAADALSTYAGVRPVIDSGKANPSAESRESALWSSPGLVGITGGKLTTFRTTAREVLRAAARQLPQLAPGADRPVFTSAMVPATQQRLYGRLGIAAAGAFLQEIPGDELQPVGDTPYSWGELRWAARHEAVVHLDDLLLRRTRLGLVSAHGGEAWLMRILDICREELGWDADRCTAEAQRYRALWRARHAPPA
ncbi:glycerol-3-phosphate dehydrogenase [Fontimonas thermophila]|uniref:Glycerol-3-phosphate dehydrogenase n=1 Tax=Fontimonas thermophila TaxID=1076937 RepID=A0A1I2HZZ2_9GAMM|nr:glycerol-3-phosphate dehydrogenase/oxidase [Fontimonas thermophila]SFF34156.1 glycerol-3-phosphate dehydrogenase [Fontimonas thermophila]